jgi:hypothetical protein
MAVFIALEPLYTRREMEDGVLSSTLLTESQEAVLVINGKRKSSNEADRKAKSRQVEGKDEKAKRLFANAQRNKKNRRAETNKETTIRQKANAERDARRRNAESKEEAVKRKMDNAEREARRRTEQSKEKAEVRKIATAKREAKRRENETDYAAGVRRAKMAMAIRERRATCPTKCVALDALDEDEIVEHFLGNMDQICDFCGAKYFKAEKNQRGIYFSCCHGGTIPSPSVRPVPS